MIQRWTTYMDNKQRKWVVTNTWFETIDSNDVVEVSLYLVGSDQQFITIPVEQFRSYIEQKQFILINNQKLK